jgi:hypothetical protein
MNEKRFETVNSDSPSPIAEAQYFEATPEFNVGSWSPSRVGDVPYLPSTQVHMRIGTPPGICSVVRFKGPELLDAVIDSLIKHREDVWGKR